MRTPFFLALMALALSACITEQNVALDDAGTTPDAGITLDGGEPLDASPCVGQLEIAPGELHFGLVAPGDAATRQISLTNTGGCPLQLTTLTLDGSQAFTPLLNGRDPRRQPDVLQDPDDDGTPGLSPGASATLDVRFSADDNTPAAATLTIRHTGASATVEVPLSANQEGACLQVDPGVLSFEPVPLGQTADQILQLSNCGTLPTNITALHFSDDTDPAFTLRDELPLPVPVDHGGGQVITVRFAPMEARPHQGTLIIETDDPNQPTRRIGLLGLGAGQACPEAHALPVDERQPVGAVLTLDGSASLAPTNPDGQPTTWQWRVIQRPAGSDTLMVEALRDPEDPSSGGLPDDVTTPQAQFVVDQPGRYVFQLDVSDRQGARSDDCGQSATVVVVAGGASRLRVRLTWTTPGDPTVGDNQGTDLDLHLVHPLAESPEDARWACYSRNPVPDWGAEGPVGDPTLDVDDANGEGPETIVLTGPESTADYARGYRVTVHSVRDPHTFGPSIATVQVFGDNTLLGEAEAELDVGGWWTPFEIAWPEGTLTQP
jgi:hypothetical protein